MSFSGEATIETVDAVDYALEERPWRFAIDEAARIDAHWAKRCAASPALFNGRVLLMHGSHMVTESGRRILRGTCSPVEFKAFLAWRDFGRDFGLPETGVQNVFAMAALRSADDAFMLGVMGAHTANPGRIYFPAGTPDLDDIYDRRLDLDASVWRELAEETGLAAADVSASPGWTLVLEPPRIACMKIMQAPLSAEDLATRFAAFNATQPTPELSALRPVFSRADLDAELMPSFMLAYLRHALGES